MSHLHTVYSESPQDKYILVVLHLHTFYTLILKMRLLELLSKNRKSLQNTIYGVQYDSCLRIYNNIYKNQKFLYIKQLPISPARIKETETI